MNNFVSNKRKISLSGWHISVVGISPSTTTITQKDEALTVRVAKATETEGKEKVNISFVIVNMHLRDVREERDQFNEGR
ncbi:hypothetical protein V6N11_030065 [Hibiscus sabdariffa]|uniref:Uncharacterized protein n=1 Tax=Hibiscus sabdariffa TaxID=183260 RepID=A0ABR2PJQ6_9ROSI